MDNISILVKLLGLLLLLQRIGLINSVSIANDNQQQQQQQQQLRRQQRQINFNDNSILRDSNKSINNNNLNKINKNYNDYHRIDEPSSSSSAFIESVDNVDHFLVENNKIKSDNNAGGDGLANINGDSETIDDDDISSSSASLNLNDQVRLLTKQLNALMMRRREDYKILENNLKKSLRKSRLDNLENIDVDIHNELEQLRNEIKDLRNIIGNGNKEKLTVEWLTQSIAEMRKELIELQNLANKASKSFLSQQTSNENLNDMKMIKGDLKKFQLELEALKERQQTSEIFIGELREEILQKEEDFQRFVRLEHKHKQQQQQQLNDDESSLSPKSIEYYNIEPEADHKMRHQRFLRQQLHDLELSQQQLKRQLNEMQYHRIGDRVHNIEIEQRRLANANFNLSRQIANLDKLHSSMLELLEDVGNIQTKLDKSIPDIKHEISKLEFTTAQLNSEQNFLKEEEHNSAKSIQALAVSISTLQNERDSIKDLPVKFSKIEENFERLESIAKTQKSIVHRRIEKMENTAKPDHHKFPIKSQYDEATTTNKKNQINRNTEIANNLVQELQSVELQYESIINKLPTDCSQVEISINNENQNSSKTTVNNNENGGNGGGGLYLIAPAGQHRPTLAQCNPGGWTTIQRRYDGSVDFNRSWESYAQGFGSPSGEFWIGNDMLHHLTADNCTSLKIIMQDIYDNTWYAIYQYFYISSRDDGYRLYINDYNGNASDALDYQNHMQFSAIDVDRDISNTHCAANYEGGWWFSHCQHANLNGRYNLGLTWFDASRNEWIAVKSSQMMIIKNQKKCSLNDDNRKHEQHQNNDNVLVNNDDTVVAATTATTDKTLSTKTTNPINTQLHHPISSTSYDDDKLTIENNRIIRTTTTINSVV